MSAPGFDLRPAVASDAAALAAFGRRVFFDTYAPDNEPADMELHLSRTFGPERQAAELADPGSDCVLAIAAGAIVGYALVRRGPAPPPVTGPEPCEVRRFYVDGAWHGRGVAAALMDAAVAAARARGARTLWLTAWERNPRARRFYEKSGFADVGTGTFLLGRSLQTDRVFARPLDAP